MRDQQKKTVEEAADKFVIDNAINIYFGREAEVKNDFISGAEEVLSNPERYGLIEAEKRVYLKSLDTVKEMLQLAILGYKYQESNSYHPDQLKASREEIGAAKRFIEYIEKKGGEQT